VLSDGERQVASSLDGIRRDHVARYRWAAKQLPANSCVLDVACGIGYGSKILADAGHQVDAVDRDAEAIAYAKRHYRGKRIRYECADLAALQKDEKTCDAVVCFETIEHLQDPLPALKKFRALAPLLIASVPNETVFPYRGYKFHHRHYTREQFAELLNQAGYAVTEWHGQRGPESEVDSNIEGRTTIVVAKRANGAVKTPPPKAIPHHVTILAMGPSAERYFDVVKRCGGRRAFSDEVWAINAYGDIAQCDRIFHMDDVKIQESRVAAIGNSNIDHMLRWMKTHPGPIYTSRVREGYPGLVEYPLQDVIRNGGWAYFNNTAAYAIAFAVHLGVKELSIFGMDFTYPNMHQGEQGRACCEFWLGIAAARGMILNVPEETTLMDACVPEKQKFYGYDCVEIEIKDDDKGSAVVSFKDRESVPSALEIERRYDHSQHTNNLLRAKGKQQ